MKNVVGYAAGGRPVSKSSAGVGSGGGDVDDILKRLGVVESHVSELRSQVSAILAVIPHLATKADLGLLDAKIAGIDAKIARLETSIVKWIIALMLASGVLNFTITKFVH